MKVNLIFEKVGDVNNDYPYLCVYKEGEREPFMEISVSKERLSLFFIVELIIFP